jgi:hypothetical protein
MKNLHWLGVVVVLMGFVVVLGAGAGGCGIIGGACSCPSPPNSVLIDLGCVSSEPPTVTTTGPCSVCPEENANGSIPTGSHCAVLGNVSYVIVVANGSGTCHVDLTYAGGATSSVDFDFTAEWFACGSDPHGCGQGFVTTDQASIPGPTCDGGLGSGAAVDAQGDVVVDAQTDAGADLGD